MNERELLFIVRFRNAAKRQLSQLQRQLSRLGKTAGGVVRRGLLAASAALVKLGATAQKVGLRLKTVGLAIRELGTGLTFALGAPLALAFGKAVKESIKFENAMVQVDKTVKTTPEKLAALGVEFTELSESIPIAATELANIGSIAGQMGVAVPQIKEFTQVVAEVAVSARDLNAEQAAFALARLRKILGEPVENVRKLASGIIELGNSFEATEGEIADVALRFGSIGESFGFTTGEVLGVSAAIKVAGQKAQAGSTAFQRVVISLDQAVSQGGDKLRTFAKVANKSVGEFKKLFEEDAAKALTVFIEGLQGLKVGADTLKGVEDGLVSGDQLLDHLSSTNQFLGGQVDAIKALGLEDARLIKVILAVANAEGTLRETIEAGNEAFEKGTALADESGKFFAQFSNRFITQVKNPLTNAFREIGDSFRPQMEAVLELLTKFATFMKRVAKAFTEMSDKMRNFIAIAVGIGVAIGPVLIVIGTLIAVLGGVVFAIGLVTHAVGLFTIAMKIAAFAIGPTGLIILGIIALVAIIATLTDSWDVVGQVVKFVVNGVIKAVQILFTIWKTEFQIGVQIIKNFVDIIKDKFSGVIDGVKAVGSAIVDGFKAAGAFVANLFDGLGEKFGNFFGGVINGVDAMANAVGVDLGAIVDSAKDLLFGEPDEETLFEKIFKGVPELAQKGVEDIRAILASDPTGELLAAFERFFNKKLPELAAKGGKEAGKKVKENVKGEVDDIPPTFWDNFVASFAEATIRMKDGFRTGFENLLKSLADVEGRAASAVQNMADSISNTFTDLITTGKANFADLGRSILSELAKVAASQLFRTVLGAVAKSTSGSTGILGIIGSFAAAGAAEHGGLAEDLPKVLVPSHAFNNAKRFQRGGKVGVGRDTIPALLRPGERVLTPEQQRDGAGGGVTINMTVTTPDANSFRRAEGQVGAEIAARLARARSRDG